MASQVIEANREGAEVYHGMALCAVKSAELLAEINMPPGLLPLGEVEEVGYNRATGFVWLRQKKALMHTFKQIPGRCLYEPEMTAFVEDRWMKRMTGVKSKQLLIWVTISDIFIDKDDHSRITFKSTAGLAKTYPVSAFGKEDGASVGNGKAAAAAAPTNGKEAAAVGKK